MRKTEVALLAENDQLRMAIADALGRLDAGALQVKCRSCGSNPKMDCYGSGPMADPHEVRVRQAADALRQVLVDALGRRGRVNP